MKELKPIDLTKRVSLHIEYGLCFGISFISFKYQFGRMFILILPFITFTFKRISK
jgi:hypothetical protein